MSANFDYRDYEIAAKPQSDFAKIFGARKEYVLRKAKYRGAIPGRHLRNIENLTPAEAKHFLIHDAHGRALLRDVGGDIDELASALVEASNRVDVDQSTDPDQEESNMDKNFDIVKFAKRVVDDGVSAISEQQAFELVQKYASDHRLVNETPAAAFARVYGGGDDIALNFRKMITIAKGHAHPHV